MSAKMPWAIKAMTCLRTSSAPVTAFRSLNSSLISRTSRRFQSTVPPSRPKSKSRIIPIFLTLGTIAGLGYGLNTEMIKIDLAPKSSEFSLKIEEQLQANPLVAELRANSKFVESRPHLKIPGPLRQHSFTGGDMIAPNKMPVAPLVFNTADGTELYAIFYLGRSLCGHPGIVHGGLLATIMDEGLARTCFNALPNKVGMTATLTVNYRAPCKAEQWVVLRGKTTKVDGRKAWVEGSVAPLAEDGTIGKTLVDGTALFVEPRNAKLAGALMRIVS